MRRFGRSSEWMEFYFLFKEMIPKLRSDLSFIREISKVIDHFRFDNVEDLFRIDITAFGTFALVAVYQIDVLFEIGYRIDRVSIIDLKATGIEDHKAVKHLEYVGARLMN